MDCEYHSQYDQCRMHLLLTLRDDDDDGEKMAKCWSLANSEANKRDKARKIARASFYFFESPLSFSWNNGLEYENLKTITTELIAVQ